MFILFILVAILEVIYINKLEIGFSLNKCINT